MWRFETLFPLSLAMIAGFGYHKAWWSYVRDSHPDEAVLLGLAGLILLGGLVSVGLGRGLRLIGGSVVFAGYVLASLS